PPSTARAAPAAAAATGGPAGADAAPERLTPREQEILALLAAGDSNKLIARALDLSVHTVKQHVASILGKLGVANRGQAAAWWHAQSG
ncbi:MAG: helix-turn-helix transcriptional regulator, partial [Burkholderiales bacterium]|nr:helix-turn-helix transcriptional regulator [Burkholderiales bacterium]